VALWRLFPLPLAATWGSCGSDRSGSQFF
jgi:hypothetical protein